MPQRKSHFPGSSSNSTPLKRKRDLSPPPTTSTSRSRQSQRIKSSSITPGVKTTPKKSPYFKHPTSESESDDNEVEDSGYEDEDASAVPSTASSSDAESSAYASSGDDAPAKKKSRGRKPGGPKKKTIPTANGTITAPIPTSNGKDNHSELWRPGVKVSGEGEVFISLPKARKAGSTPYTDSTLHPNTLLFLGDLRKHNDRDWLKTHDADYRQSLRDWNSFVDALTPQLMEKDDTIPELPYKDLTFRIYRDIRFSPDPTPYKTHFSAAWSRTGRKGPYAGYYVQVQPGGSFVGAGVWHPEAAPLALLRKSVDRHAERLKGVLKGERLRREFLGDGGGGKGAKGKGKAVGEEEEDKEVVKRFVNLNSENALKTKPRDYVADHPDIALLRLRNYTIGKKLKDEDVLGPKGLDRIVDLLGVLTPFVTHLNSVVMPDEDPSSDEDDEAEDEEDGGEENGVDGSSGDDDDDDENE